MGKEVLYEVKPKVNLIYEIFMPTGKKIRYTFTAMMIITICMIIFNFINANMNLSEKIVNVNWENLLKNINIMFVILIVVLLFKLLIHIVFKVLQYKAITYTFYNEFLEYKDKFLNQHEKTIQYNNIKEVEIIKTIFDRIMGYGVIVIHTNAENDFSNGLVMYSIKDPQKVYNTIDEIIHKKNGIKNEIKN